MRESSRVTEILPPPVCGRVLRYFSLLRAFPPFFSRPSMTPNLLPMHFSHEKVALLIPVPEASQCCFPSSFLNCFEMKWNPVRPPHPVELSPPAMTRPSLPLGRQSALPTLSMNTSSRGLSGPFLRNGAMPLFFFSWPVPHGICYGLHRV